MKREIKFRAWDAEQNHMLRADLLEQGWLVKELNNPKFNVMQFTGLRDKNGKEIYEGDVVNGYTKATVYYESDFAGFYPMCNWPGDGKWEIIGNVYENP